VVERAAFAHHVGQRERHQTPGPRGRRPTDPFPVTENRPAPKELLSDVRRYARYRVDLLRAPHEAAQTRARYGIANDQAHADLVAAFDARFADDPNLAAEYQEAVRTYSAWLNESGGSHG